MVAFNSIFVVLAGVLSVQAIAEPKPKPKCCAADKCFASANLSPQYKPTASAFCQKYINKTPGTVTRTTTKTVTSTRTTTPSKQVVTKPTTVTGKASTVTTVTTVTPDVPLKTVTTPLIDTVTSPTPCSTVVRTTFPTSVLYTTRGSAPLDRRGYPMKPRIPYELSSGCSSKGLEQKVSSACSCFLTKKTVTRTATATAFTTVTALPGKTTLDKTVTATAVPTTVTSTNTAATPDTVTVTVTSRSTQTQQTCTSTSTSYQYDQLSCGIQSPTAVASGSISCTQPAPAGETNNRFRIEGNTAEGTIFEDCVISGPRNITTPSGGTHLCDGTNNNNNPSPGATLTTDINDAGSENGFDFDGSYSNQFQDFFITRISATAQTGSQYWGVLRDRVFTNAGGCQEQVIPGTEGLWAFDAFNANAFLKLDPEYQVVQLGDTASVTVTVTGTDGNGAALSPVGGASVGGQTSDSNGNVQIQVPDEPGCYQYKAVRSGTIRSNAFYLTVLPADGE